MLRLSRLSLFLTALFVTIVSHPGTGRAGDAGEPDLSQKFYAGLQAYNVGDYTRAAAIWRRLAAFRHGNSESGLGLLYYTGQGVTRDLSLAREYFGRAASKGVVQAHLFLSMIYFRGDGVPRDYVRAYMWSDIGVANGYAPAIGLRDLITEFMTEADIQMSRRLSVEWQRFYLR